MEYLEKKRVADEILSDFFGWDALPDVNSLHDAETEEDIVVLCEERIQAVYELKVVQRQFAASGELVEIGQVWISPGGGFYQVIRVGSTVVLKDIFNQQIQGVSFKDLDSRDPKQKFSILPHGVNVNLAVYAMSDLLQSLKLDGGSLPDRTVELILILYQILRK